MASAKTVLEAEIYGALAELISGATVFQDVPENQPYPIVMIGEMKSVPGPCKDDPDRQITVTIVSIVSAEERAPLLEIMADVESALDGRHFGTGEWVFEGSFQADEAALAEDGVSYVGTSEFLFLAFKV